MTGGDGGPLRDALARITRRLEDLAAAVARLEPGETRAPVGEPLPEAARRSLGGLESLLAVGPGVEPATAWLLAVDRAIHRAGADAAALYLTDAEGRLAAVAHRGLGPGRPAPIAPSEGLVGRAFVERETIQGGPAHRGADPLMREHGLEQALAVPVRPGGGPATGILFAGRRRPAPFETDALRVLHLLADRVALLGGRLAGDPAEHSGPEADLDLPATAARIVREAARRLGAPRVALLLADPGRPRVVAVVGVPVDAVPPDGGIEPLAGVRLTGRIWVAGDERPPAAVAAFLGAPPRLVAPLGVGGRAVALLVAGGPSPLSPAGLEGWLEPAARALRNARLHAEVVAGLAEARAWERRPAAAAPAPARDFTGLLAVLLARVGLVRERVSDPALAADLAVAEEAAWRAAEAVRDLLGFGPGLHGGELSPVDLGAVVRTALEEASRRWAEHGVEGPAVELGLEPLPPVRASADDLREALGQLLANAAEAGGGPVRVGASWDGGGRVELVVQDAGSGMDEGVRARALEPFFSTKGRGRLGLGLPVVQAIVARHRGALQLESVPGRGTTVRITLPTAAGAGPVGAPPASAPARVLVIEADRVVRDALVALLEQQGHVALGAADGEAGLVIVQREALDAVVTDWGLPTLSGLDVAHAAKRIQPGTGVILMTAWPGCLDPAAVRERGIDQVVEKPIEPALLAEAIEAVLARRREGRA